MAGKRITTELVVKAVDQYSPLIKNMTGVTGRFASKVRSEMGRMQGLRGPLRMIEDFRRQQDVVRGSANALDAANEKTRQLLATIRATKNPTAAMRREFERARTTAGRLEEKHRRNRAELRGLQSQMQSAGVDTADLAGEQRRLAGALDAANGKFARQAERMQRLKVMQDRIAEGRERMQRSLATAANLSFVGNASMQTGRRILTGMSAPIMQAVEFESAMSDVRKVVDFESPAAFKEMSEDILLLSTKVPMSTSALAMLAATGGQLGIAREDLMDFSIQAAKIGIAFDISAEKAAGALGTMQNALGLDLAESGKLFDAMNFVSNNSAARADQTLDFLNRAGASGQTFGFDPAETLAIGSAMIAAGAGADTAATSFRNMGRALTKGESSTKRQGSAFRKLGLNATDVAKRMQEDAVGTTQDVLQRLSKLPDHLRASVMSDLFGDEARELTKLLNNMQLMPEMLAMVADETQYLGSANAEYAERAKTTSNNMQLMRNQTTRLGISIGEVVLPPLNELLSKSQVFIDKLVTWTKENPKLTKTLVMGGVALGGMAVAGGFLLTAASGLIGTMAVLRFGLVGLGARAVFAGSGISGLVGRFGLLRRLPRLRLSSLVAPLRWTASLIPPIRWAGRAKSLGRFGMNASGWGKLITPLKWFGRGALRFIPVIGWAVMAAEIGMFAWKYLGLKELPWREYLKTAIEWKNWFFSFDWMDFLPVWSWDFIPKFDLTSKLFFSTPPSALSSNPKEVKRAVTRGQSLGYGQTVQPLAGARAVGGPVRAGFPYLVNENTPRSEVFVPSLSGGILNVSQAQAAVRASMGGANKVRTAGLSGLAASVVVGSTLAAAPAGDVSGRSNSARVEIGSISIVAPSGVSDPEGLADLIETRLGDRIAATFDASFSD